MWRPAHGEAAGRVDYIPICARPQQAWVIMLLLRASHCQTWQASDCTKRWVSSRLASTGRSDVNLMPGTMSVGGSDSCERCGREVEAISLITEGDRKSVVSGKRVSVRVDLGGRRSIKKKKKNKK